ncbi:hypothetical protein [Phage f2b1]|nr:hypothetical protein [Phage f2b1]
MTSYSQDRKWLEAKRAVGHLNWLEVISYYRSIGGDSVFVYSIVEGDKRLIVDILADESILLINREGLPVTDSYDNVLKSRKAFNYSDTSELRTYTVGKESYQIAIEKLE